MQLDTELTDRIEIKLAEIADPAPGQVGIFFVYLVEIFKLADIKRLRVIGLVQVIQDQ